MIEDFNTTVKATCATEYRQKTLLLHFQATVTSNEQQRSDQL
jgi:hypothetical protein